MSSIASILATCTDAPVTVAHQTDVAAAPMADRRSQITNPTGLHAIQLIRPDSRGVSVDEGVRPYQDPPLPDKALSKVAVSVATEDLERWHCQVGERKASVVVCCMLKYNRQLQIISMRFTI